MAQPADSLELLPTPALMWSPKGEACQANQSWLQFTGLTCEHTVADGWLQAVHPHFVDGVRSGIKEAASRGDSFEMPLQLRGSDGIFRWFLVHAHPLPAGTKRAAVWLASFTDVDQLKHEEQVLRDQARSAQEQAELVDLAHDAILIRTMAGEIVYWNRGAEMNYGYRKSEAIGQVCHVLLQAQFSRPLQQIENHLLRHGRWEGMVVHYRRGGEKRTINSRWALKRDERGSPARVLEIHTDITERRKAEESLQFLADASETLASLGDYDTVLQNLSRLAVPFLADWCIVFHENNQGRLSRVAMTHADPRMQAIVDEIQQKFPLENHAPPPLIARVLRDGQAELAPDFNENTLHLVTIDEQHRSLVRRLQSRSLLCLPLQVRGRIVGAIAFLTDVSAKRYSASDLAVAEEFVQRGTVALDNATLYAEAREADRRKDEFLATLAHELRNPLAPIRNAVELMHFPGVGEQELNWARDAIDRQTQHLTRLVDDLLDVSRITRGKVELRKQKVDLNAIIARAIETSRPLITQHNHRLEVALPEGTLPIQADPTRLEQIFANLLNNAAKYTEPNGKIALTVQTTGDSVVARVCDTGIGMSPEFLPRVFDMFVQAEHHHGRSQGGLGIGLSLVRSLVEMHGGTIEAHSAGLGQGSEFVVHLPLPLEANEGGEQRGLADRWTSTASHDILVVDDNVDAAKSLAMLLRVLGQRTRVAHDGEAALRMVEERRPDLVFLDIGLPRIDGYSVAREIRHRRGGVDITLVALTGWGQEEDRRRSREAGFDDHLTKPVDQATLQRILNLPGQQKLR